MPHPTHHNQRHRGGFRPVNTLNSQTSPTFALFEDSADPKNNMVNEQEAPRAQRPLFSPSKKVVAGDNAFEAPRIPLYLQGGNNAAQQQQKQSPVPQAAAQQQPTALLETVKPRNPLKPNGYAGNARSNPMFNVPKHGRPEHHRPPVAAAAPNPLTTEAPRSTPGEFTFRAPQPFGGHSQKVPQSIQPAASSTFRVPKATDTPPKELPPLPDVFEIPKPVQQSSFSTIPSAPKPLFSSKGFHAVNSWKAPGSTSSNFVDLTRSVPVRDADDEFNPDFAAAAAMGGGINSYDPSTYLDSAQTSENIKALLEGAFDEDEDDKPKTRLRRRQNKEAAETNSAVDELADLAKGLNVKDDAKDKGTESQAAEEEEDDGTVDGLKVKLLPHQIDGVAWMLDKEIGQRKKNGVLPKGGILADDMGLGKTIQALSLILSNARPEQDSKEAEKLKIPKTAGKGTLVVAPLALIKQWEGEIKDKVDESHRFKIVVHHGPSRTRRSDDLKKYDVVITTYETLVSEHGDSSDKEDGRRVGVMGVHWYRVILDEAHKIKNRNAKMTKGAYALQAVYRWCLTGTPMQNNLDELQSLICFLRIKPYCDLRSWKDQIGGPMKNGRGGLAIKRLQYFLKALMKRRTKDILKKEGGLTFGKNNSSGKSKEGFKIVERKVQSIVVEFDDQEQNLYDGLASRTEKSLKDMASESNYLGALVLLLRLRQTCNHPELIRGRLNKDKDTLSTEQTSSAAASNGNVDDLANMFGGMSVETRTCDACRMPLGVDACAKGAIRCADCERDLEAITHLQPGEAKAKVESDKSRRNRRIVDSDDEDEDDNDDDEEDDEEDDEDDIDDEDQEDDEDLGHAGGSDDENADGKGQWLGADDSDTENDISDTDARYFSSSSEDKKTSRRRAKTSSRRPGTVTSHLPDRVSSTKIRKLLEILDQEAPEHKVIVFSEFTSMLDIIEPFLASKGHKYVRYDGSMRNDEREASLTALRNDKRIRVLLCSLKCGSLGLNLTAASRVVMLEPFWNPFVEEQAIDRVHRLNQTRDVVVYKLTVRGTVEERILALQERKRELAKAAIEGGKAVGKLSMKDILNLFKRDAESDAMHGNTGVGLSSSSSSSSSAAASARKWDRPAAPGGFQSSAFDRRW